MTHPAESIVAAGMEEVSDDRHALVRVFAAEPGRNRRLPRRSIAVNGASIRDPSEVLERIQAAGQALCELVIGPSPGLGLRILGTFLGKGLLAPLQPQHSLIVLLVDEVPAWLPTLLAGAIHDYPRRCSIPVAWTGTVLVRPEPCPERGRDFIDWLAGVLTGDGSRPARGDPDPS